jgi:hypothetical protein
MTILARVIIAMVLYAACAALARADTTTIGITLNGTTGAHVEPNQAEAVPFLPLPMFELEHVHKNLRLRLEAVPPIGPVPLAQNSSLFGDNQDPRVSFLNGEVLYAPPDVPYAFGLGETVINQRTLYPPSSIAQSSRVVGLRLLANATLYENGPERAEASVAVNPSLQGLQQTSGASLMPLAEYGSLFDASLRWTVSHDRYDFVYGVRYLNYTAAYRIDNSLADRNHLFMPFVGIDWPLEKRKHASVRTHSAAHPQTGAPAPAANWTFGVGFLGTNGARTTSVSFAPTILPFNLVPVFSVAHTVKRYELSGEFVAPNEHSDPYGASQTWWSYINVDALAHLGNSRLALGVGDTIVNLAPAPVSSFVSQHTRAEGLHLTVRTTLVENLHGALIADALITPYSHVLNQETTAFAPPALPRVFTTTDHGARIEASLHHLCSVGNYRLDYGLRYVNQTTNYGALDPSHPQSGVLLTRTSSLMPFVGLRVPF